MTNLSRRLIDVSDRFAELTGISRTQQSYQIFRDQRRLDRVATATVDLRLSSFEGAMRWLSEKWPDGAAWPEGIERPVAAPAEGEAA